MASSLQTLIKILNLEKQKGFENKAVIGGFARFAYHWAREAHAQAQTDTHHTLVDEIADGLRRYEESAPEDRPSLLVHIVALATGDAPVDVDQPASPEPAPSEAPSTVSPADSPPPMDEPSPEPAPPPRQASAAPIGQEASHRKTVVDDVGIGLPDTEDDDYSQNDEVIEVFGTFDHHGAEGEQRSVRERRGYARQERYPASPEALTALDAALTVISGIGESRAEQFARLGAHQIRDLLTLFPHRYDDYSRMKTINRLVPDEEVTVIGVIEDIAVRDMRSGGKRVECHINDGSGKLRLNWFNQPWMAQQLEKGEPYVASGKVEQYLGLLVMNSPEMEAVDKDLLHAGRVVPVYPLTEGLGARTMRRLMKQVIDEWAPLLPDFQPMTVRENADLMDYGDALQQAHFPDTWEDMQAARYRLAFDEVFTLQLAMLRQRYEWQSRQGIPLYADDDWLAGFTSTLPYELTDAQWRAINDIRHDMALNVPMNRLLQGDVGSGKTVVAALACGVAVANGVQAAIMAPTSILSEQHSASFSSLLTNFFGPEINVALLTGNISQGERDSVYEGLANGSIHVVVGTHALIQPGVQFARLGLAVIDEQHRFGVAQRGALRDKADGGNPHLLVMTATPIPRTLALTFHADLDLTVIDEMPPGRVPVQTRVFEPKERERCYSFIKSRLDEGLQAYIITPLVDESDSLDARSAVGEYERLQNGSFKDYRLGLLHGQMRPDEKDTVMGAFYNGEIDVLVSTTVIEVGIDVPNAAVIMVENANRFGLAQLHQLRGRVGRGEVQSYCLLVASEPFDDLEPDERLKAVESTTDGFKLAEVDWKMRGAGNLLGRRQSGFGTIEFADLMDPHLIDAVQREAWRIYKSDPELSLPEHQLLGHQVAALSIDPGDIS